MFVTLTLKVKRISITLGTDVKQSLKDIGHIMFLIRADKVRGKSYSYNK